MKAAAIIFLLSLVAVVHGNWQEWWTYDGISGPGYWGVINPAWTLCNRGRHQVDSVVEFQKKRARVIQSSHSSTIKTLIELGSDSRAV